MICLAEENKKEEETSIGLKENEAAFFAYLFLWLSGLVIYLLEKKSDFVRFHAFQSFAIFIGFTVAIMLFGLIPFIGWIFLPFVFLAMVIVWLFCMIKAYQKEMFKLPIVGDFAEQQIKSSGAKQQ